MYAYIHVCVCIYVYGVCVCMCSMYVDVDVWMCLFLPKWECERRVTQGKPFWFNSSIKIP